MNRLLLLIVVLVFTSCASSKISEEKPLKQKSPSFLLKHCNKQMLNFDWAGMKLSADLYNNQDEESFSANIKMRDDSVIWISLSPALGVEVFRVHATPDSLKILSKLPKKKYYSLGEMKKLEELIGFQLDFSSLQDIFVGRGYEFHKEDSKFRSKIDGGDYVLLSKYNRRVRRVVGEDDRMMLPNDSLKVVNEDVYDRAIDHSSEEDLLVRRFWIDGENYNLKKMVVNDLFHQRTIQLEYSEFKTVGEQTYPSKGVIRVKDPETDIRLEYKINRIRLNKAYEFPFTIPENFEEKEL